MGCKGTCGGRFEVIHKDGAYRDGRGEIWIRREYPGGKEQYYAATDSVIRQDQGTYAQIHDICVYTKAPWCVGIGFLACTFVFLVVMRWINHDRRERRRHSIRRRHGSKIKELHSLMRRAENLVDRLPEDVRDAISDTFDHLKKTHLRVAADADGVEKIDKAIYATAGFVESVEILVPVGNANLSRSAS